MSKIHAHAPSTVITGELTNHSLERIKENIVGGLTIRQELAARFMASLLVNNSSGDRLLIAEKAFKMADVFITVNNSESDRL